MADVTQLQGGYDGPDTIPDKGTTTLIIRNLPRSYTPQAVMSELKVRCPTSQYNFVYLPWYKRRGCNIGFAFLNFVDAESATRAFFALSGSSWTLVSTTKICRVSAAHIQGLRKNLANYVAIVAQSRVDESGVEEDEGPHPPIVIQGGSIMELSEAIRTLCTEEMLQEAMGNNRTHKLSLQQLQNPSRSLPSGPCSGLTPQPHSSSQHSLGVRIQHSSSPMERARDFRKAFLEFCSEVARRAADRSVEEVGRPEGGEDVANIEFWMNFRSLCIRFPEIAPTILDIEWPERAAHHAACDTSWRHTSPASLMESHMIKRVAYEHVYAPGQWGIQHQLPMSNSSVQPVLSANDAVRFPHDLALQQRTFDEGTNWMPKPMPNSMADFRDLEIPIPAKLLASTSVGEPCIDTISLQL